MGFRGRGRPEGGRLPDSMRDAFWDALRTGITVKAASAAAGVSRFTGAGWLAEAGGVRPRTVNPVLEASITPGKGRLDFVTRCRIEDLLRARYRPVRIGELLGRPTATITREIARGRTGPEGPYRAVIAQGRVDENRRRPRARKLAPGTRLFTEVLQRLKKRHSPEQIANRLHAEFPDDPEMWVSHETIYQALFVQARGELREEVKAALRSGRTRRKVRGRASADGPKLRGMINISERPAEAADRAVPGHWEGDLIIGAKGLSAVGTLVERSTGFVVLLHLRGDRTAATLAEAITAKIPEIPEILCRSLTWDQGREMALHTKITEATGLPIYFCDPHSPWQRGTNENTNGLLRQYLPKGTDLSFYGPGMLDNIAAELNARPRKRHDWKTPAEKLEELLSEPTDSVAFTA
jgi:IS30 family transposase